MISYKSFIAVTALMVAVSGPVAANAASVAASTATTATDTVNGAVDANTANAAAGTSTSANGSANANTSSTNGTSASTGVDGNVAANGNGSTDFDHAMGSVNGSQSSSAQIQGMKTVGSVNVVKIADVATGDNQKALDTAITAHKQDIAKLRTALCSNSAIEAALSKKSIDCKNVVAATADGGALTVYVN